MQTAKLYETILGKLADDYIKPEPIARIVAQSLASGKNSIIYGPAGHGKSEMTRAALNAVGFEGKGKLFIQFFGEGMSEARLYGGLDFKKLNKEDELEYKAGREPGGSFMDSEAAIFEELFDAPAKVLLALKDTLTSRQLNNGSQVVPMKTKCIICLTNRSPQEISEMGPAAHALVERFPLRLYLRWETYTIDDYTNLLRKIDSRTEGPDVSAAIPVLAEMMAEQVAAGVMVSPRTAVHAMGVLQGSARLRGDKKVNQYDYRDLMFIPELNLKVDELDYRVARAQQREAALQTIREADKKVAEATKSIAEFGEKFESDPAEHAATMAGVMRKTDSALSKVQNLLESATLPDSLMIAAKERCELIEEHKTRMKDYFINAFD